MHDRTARVERCTILRNNGDFCDLTSVEDMPFPICGKHAIKLYRHLSDLTHDELSDLAPRAASKAPKGHRESRHRNDALRSVTAGQPTVYAVRFPDGIIKIGHTTDLPQRLTCYAHAGGDLVGFMIAGYSVEQEIHRTLLEHRARGREWYHPVPPVLGIVNEMRDQFALPPLVAA